MARYALIDGYLEAMRDGLSWRRDLDDVVSEMEDHLYSTVEHICSSGKQPADAQRIALDRFGDPTTVATVYASTNTGGLAMPTEFTRRAGTAAIIAAGLLTLFGMYWIIWSELLEPRFEWETTGSIVYMVMSFLGLTGAFALMTVTTVAIIQRTGTRGFFAIGAITLMGLGAVATLGAWFIGGWMLFGGLGALTGSIMLLRSGVAPNGPSLLYGLGLLAGLCVFVVLSTLEFGGVDQWGDYPVANEIGVGIGCFLTAVGLAGVGRWLHSEEPADIEHTPITA